VPSRFQPRLYVWLAATHKALVEIAMARLNINRP